MLAARGINVNAVEEPVLMDVDDGPEAKTTNGTCDISVPDTVVAARGAVKQGPLADERLQLATQLREEIEALSV